MSSIEDGYCFPQNEPIKPTGVEALVCSDIAVRQLAGIKKYCCTVWDNPLTLKEWLQHAYLESLDHSIYLKRAILELEKNN